MPSPLATCPPPNNDPGYTTGRAYCGLNDVGGGMVERCNPSPLIDWKLVVVQIVKRTDMVNKKHNGFGMPLP